MNISRKEIVWAYFRQRLFDPEDPIILRPRKFVRRYKEDYLEYCFSLRYEEVGK